MIRQFRPEDAQTCSSLIHECIADDSSLSTGLREQLRKAETPDAMLERARLFYVAVYESEDKIAGIAGLDLNEVRILCVSRQYRKKGIGRALLQFVQSMVPSALFPDVFVYSSIQGKEFYRACGFVENGRVDFSISGEQLPTVFMTFQLR